MMPMPSGMLVEKLVDLAKANPKDKTLKFIAEDHDKLEIEPQCGNGRLLKLTGPSHGYETHPPSLMVKVYEDAESAERDSYVIKTISQLVKGLLPDVWKSCHHENLIVYEELPGFTNVALDLIEGITVNKVALQTFAKYLAALHNASSELSGDELVEFKSKLKNSQAPFHNNVNGTGCDTSSGSPGDDHEENNTTDSPSKAVDDYLSEIYDREEAITLGQYSIADVYVKSNEIMVLNVEKVQVGPCASDLAVLLGTLIKLYTHHMLTPEDNDKHRRVSYKLMDACKLTVDSYLEHATWHKCENKETFVSAFMSDVAVITGTWLIRDSKERPEVNGQNAEMFAAGGRLLRAYSNIHDISRLLFIALQLC